MEIEREAVPCFSFSTIDPQTRRSSRGFGIVAASDAARGGIPGANWGLFHICPPLRRSAAAWMGGVFPCDGPHILRSFFWRRLWIQEILAYRGLHGRCRSGLVMAIAGVGAIDGRAARQRRERATLKLRTRLLLSDKSATGVQVPAEAANGGSASRSFRPKHRERRDDASRKRSCCCEKIETDCAPQRSRHAR